VTTPAQGTKFFFDEIFELGSMRIVATRTRHAFERLVCPFFEKLLFHIRMAIKAFLKSRRFALGCGA
jgi:hypothetical protein